MRSIVSIRILDVHLARSQGASCGARRMRAPLARVLLVERVDVLDGESQRHAIGHDLVQSGAPIHVAQKFLDTRARW
jgi:hypothetical protein